MNKWLLCALGAGLTFSYAQNVQAEKPEHTTKWKLAWSDEFSGPEIDQSKWNFDTGNWLKDANGNPVAPGWGNSEKQFYTDKNENAFVRDGNLVIRAKREQTTDALGTYDFTSAKLTTKGSFAKTYGRYEMRAKLPVGKGLWPALWMLPEKDRYGGWAASGEIDIMESWGSKPDRVAGTIHYGESWPNNKYTGKDYHFEDGNGIDKWHTYAVEWEPGEIRWYVDGELYQTQNDWYSKHANSATKYSYPAPFDQNFYLIMNLAVGGHFDGDVDETTILPAEMEVDYVRVYDLQNRDYRDPVEPTYDNVELPEGAKQPLEDGNLIYDKDYAYPITRVLKGTDPFDPLYWNYATLSDFGGSGSVAVTERNGVPFADITIDEPGSQTYSHQLIQHVSIARGGSYKISFDASADEARSIRVKVGGGADRGFAKYSNEEAVALTTDVKNYSFTFDMGAETDLAARIEFNLGLEKAGVQIGNVRIEQVPRGTIDPDATKPALPNGNHIYNGTFDQGSMDRMTYWHFDPGMTKGTGSVNATDRLFRFVTNNKQGTPATLTQQGVQLKEGHEYLLRFKARGERADALKVGLMNVKGDKAYVAPKTVSLTNKMETIEIPFTMNDMTDLYSVLQFDLGSKKGTIEIDDVELLDVTPVFIDPAPLKNGSFADGMANWGHYIHFDAAAKIEAVDGAANIAIDHEGNEAWSVLMEQGGLQLHAGQTYVVQFNASSEVARSIEVTVENASYYRYLSQVAKLGTDMQTYTYEFTMGQDDVTGLKFLMGRGEGSPYAPHVIKIDDVKLELKK